MAPPSILASTLLLLQLACALPWPLNFMNEKRDVEKRATPNNVNTNTETVPFPVVPLPGFQPIPAPAPIPAAPVPPPLQPAPLPYQPVPVPIQPIPAPVQPLPAPNQPVPVPPVPNQPVPVPNQPVPVPNQPVPVPNQPVPVPNQPVPAPNQPIPVPNQPVPVPNQPVPAPNQPAPAPPTTPLPPTNPPTSPSPPSTPPAAGSCKSYVGGTYVSGGNTYTIQCSTDRPGGDLVSKSSQSFSGCFSICDQTQGCVGFSYVGGNNAGTCYLKSQLTTAQSNPNVDTAYMNKAPSTAPTSPAPAPAPAPAQPPQQGSCAAIGSTSYTSTAKQQYTVACNTDLAGGDIGSKSSSTFQGCFDLCDATNGCVAFTYLPGTCYFKGTVGQASPNQNVNAAFKQSASSNNSPTGCNCPPAPTVTVYSGSQS